jgi:hypothetical protein
MSNQTLKSTVLQILRQADLWKINFELHGLLVTGVRYSVIAAAVEQGSISCEAVSTFQVIPGHEPEAGMVVGAQYDIPKNTILFPSQDYGSLNIYEKSVIVHEATHAIFDMFAKTSSDEVLGIYDETAAVLAQSLYLRHFTIQAKDSAEWEKLNTNQIYAEHRFSMTIDSSGDHGIKLANKLVAAGKVQNGRTYTVTDEESKELRAAVAKEWGFVKKIGSDGYPSDRTGAKSVYDGVACPSCWGGPQRPSGASK